MKTMMFNQCRYVLRPAWRALHVLHCLTFTSSLRQTLSEFPGPQLGSDQATQDQAPALGLPVPSCFPVCHPTSWRKPLSALLETNPLSAFLRVRACIHIFNKNGILHKLLFKNNLLRCNSHKTKHFQLNN